MGNNIDLTNKDIIKIKSKEAQIIGLFKDKILDIQSVYKIALLINRNLFQQKDIIIILMILEMQWVI